MLEEAQPIFVARSNKGQTRVKQGLKRPVISVYFKKANRPELFQTFLKLFKWFEFFSKTLKSLETIGCVKTSKGAPVADHMFDKLMHSLEGVSLGYGGIESLSRTIISWYANNPVLQANMNSAPDLFRCYFLSRTQSNFSELIH